jgi:hypothetical protein
VPEFHMIGRSPAMMAATVIIGPAPEKPVRP